MAFKIIKPCDSNAIEVSQTHLRAMDDNLLMHAQFPNPKAIQFLAQWLEKDTIDHIHATDREVLVAIDEQSGRVVSFIKWSVYRRQVENGQQAEHEVWPECCRSEFLDNYADLTARTRKAVMGTKPYYHVTFLCTNPEHAGKGAASSLIRHVQGKAQADGMDVVLESTLPAVSFYQRLGFRIEKGLGIMITPRGSDEATELYKEECMVWRH